MKRIRIATTRHAKHFSATIYDGFTLVVMSTGDTLALAVGKAVASFRRRARCFRGVR